MNPCWIWVHAAGLGASKFESQILQFGYAIYIEQKNGGSQRCVLVAKCRDVYPIWFILRPNDCLVPVTPVNFKRTSQLQVCLAQLAKAPSAKIKMFWPNLMVLGSFVKSVTSAPENATFERWSLAFCTDTRKTLIKKKKTHSGLTAKLCQRCVKSSQFSSGFLEIPRASQRRFNSLIHNLPSFMCHQPP